MEAIGSPDALRSIAPAGAEAACGHVSSRRAQDALEKSRGVACMT
jgi:hypothetical protein